MREEDVRRVLLALLEEGGAAYVEENGYVRFRMERDGLLWETACRCTAGAVLIYGRCPFRVKNRDAALRECSDVNCRMTRGAAFLPEDGQIVFRTRADMSDIFDARERLDDALRYNAAALVRFWGRFQTL